MVWRVWNGRECAEMGNGVEMGAVGMEDGRAWSCSGVWCVGPSYGGQTVQLWGMGRVGMCCAWRGIRAFPCTDQCSIHWLMG